MIGKKPGCELCNPDSFLKGEEWRIFVKSEDLLVNYSKNPEVEGHIVIQPRHHFERLTEISELNWKKLAEFMWEYSKAVEEVLNEQYHGKDFVEKIYVHCISEEL